MGQLAYLKKSYFLLFNSIAMALRFHAYQSSCVSLSNNSTKKQNKLVGARGPARASNIGSNEAPTPPFIPPSIENLFTRFMKVFMETI